MAESWMRWAVAEGSSKGVTRTINKLVGTAAGSLAGSVLTPFVIGSIQMMGGFVGASARGKHLFIGTHRVLAAAFSGIIAAVMSFLVVFSFTYPGADVGITTFIVTMSIIPGAFIDRVFFGHPLVVRQWLGVGVFLLSGYAMLNFPELKTLASLPPWVLLTFGIAFLAAVNEGITQWQGRHKTDPVDPLVNNFWIGLATMLFAGTAILVFRPWPIIADLPLRFWVGSMAIGLVVISMISFKLLAYQGGGSIALKKLIMQATYLIVATILGWAAYAEPLTVGKFLGVSGYIIAFTLMDQGTWEFVSGRYFERAAATR